MTMMLSFDRVVRLPSSEIQILRSGLGLVSMCVDNVLVGGRNLNKFKSGDVNDKCYTTVSLLRAGERTGGSILREEYQKC